MTELAPLIHSSSVACVPRSQRQTRPYYSGNPGRYDLLAERSERPMRETALSMLAAKPGEKILEVIFGSRHCLVELARSVGSCGCVYGIDFSKRTIAATRRLLARDCVDLWTEVEYGNTKHLAFMDGWMDAVFTTFTLERLGTDEIPALLAECKRVLRPGGRIVVTAVSKEDREGPIAEVFGVTECYFPSRRDRHPIYVSRALESAGFMICDTSHEYMWVPVEIVLARKSRRFQAR